MFYPLLNEDNNTRSLISTWLGYNHNYRIGLGEFFDMENLSSDFYPLMTPRKTRPLLVDTTDEEETLYGILYSSGDLCYLKGTTLHYSLNDIDLSDYMEEPTTWQTLLRFGSYVLIYPANVYVNVHDFDDIGTMEDTFIADVGTTVTYSICNSNGDGYDNLVTSETTPTNPTDGMYWLKTGENSGLYIYSQTQGTFLPVATSYIRISMTDASFNSHFSEGDTITLNSTIQDINEGSTIKAIASDYIVVTGFMNEATKTYNNTTAWRLTIKRKLPRLDYVCVNNNRVWGCYYGFNEKGELLNEIYCSKLGDFKNWYTYSGISTDAYAVTVGVSGEFTGCISFQGRPHFFKDNAIYKVYGTQPSEYQVTQTDQRGVQKGSYRSLAIVNEVLVYKSATDICAYDGASPVSISDALGREYLYYDAVGGGAVGKYFVVMQDVKSRTSFFVYDFKTGLWEKESGTRIQSFSASEDGQIYAATKDKIYGMGNTDNISYTTRLIGEEWVEWYAETGEMGYEYVDFKFVSRMTLRAFVPHRSELKVEISYDDRPFENVGVIRGREDIMSQTLTFSPFRCDHYRIRLSGHGDCRIYTLAITLETGSEQDEGYTHR